MAALAAAVTTACAAIYWRHRVDAALWPSSRSQPLVWPGDMEYLRCRWRHAIADCALLPHGLHHCFQWLTVTSERSRTGRTNFWGIEFYDAAHNYPAASSSRAALSFHVDGGGESIGFRYPGSAGLTSPL